MLVKIISLEKFLREHSVFPNPAFPGNGRGEARWICAKSNEHPPAPLPEKRSSFPGIFGNSACSGCFVWNSRIPAPCRTHRGFSFVHRDILPFPPSQAFPQVIPINFPGLGSVLCPQLPPGLSRRGSRKIHVLSIPLFPGSQRG